MHLSSYNIVLKFRDLVLKHFNKAKIKILDVGSYGINGTYRDIFFDKEKFIYLGLDLQPGPNVDYVPQNPYAWPELEDNYFDVIISGQAFEHMEFPWLVINEMKKKLKSNGLICIVAPSRGPEHKYPLDCWRYYPDGFRALAKWAGLRVLEAKTCWGASGFSDGSDQWGDSFCILWKDEHESPSQSTERFSTTTQPEANKNSPLESGKTASYYSFVRGEIIEAIKKNGLPLKRILEIGCAEGATGKKIKETMPIDYYVGVEISEQAAGMARKHLDKVIVADIEKINLLNCGLKHGDFDLLLALDVLEHLYNPWDVLAGLKQFLKPGGHVVASIPNIQNITIVNGLIHGQWRYERAGILDATHIRFFTMEEIERLFSGAEFPIIKIDYLLNPPIDLLKIKDSGNSLCHENINLTNLSREDVLRLFVYQYIIIAQNSPAIGTGEKSDQIEGQRSAPSVQQEVIAEINQGIMPQILFEKNEAVKGLVSIVILTFNQLQYTIECLESIRKQTPEPYEIIFVDNGSTDESVKWLQRVIKENANYKLIENEKNLGFAKGCNQGITASSGEFILLLNNDVVVTEGWLSGMLECLNSDSGIGIVGPMTNNISGGQKVVDAKYKTIEQMHEFAKSFRERNRHQRVYQRRIVGFCMLFRRELVKKIGGLDERFHSGNFEDDDYCLRVELEDYRNCIAGDVFTHHYGSRSFIGNRIDYCSAMSGNRRVFNDKWNGIPTNSLLGKKLIIKSVIEQAEEMNEKGKADKAVERLIEGIGQSPDSEIIYQTLAGMLIEAKRFKDALDTLHAIPEGAKDNIKTLELVGYCKDGLELFQEAEGYADRVLSMEPGRASCLNLKGILAYKRDDRKAAENFFKRAIESDPGYGEPYTNLGVLRWTEGESQEGLKLLERGFILSPAVMDIASRYHSAITQTKKLAGAEGIFREAKALYPINRRISYLLIDLLLQQGKYEAAIQEIERGMIAFGIEEGLLSAALEVRGKIGPQEIDRARKGKGSLSLCMIVKNEEEHLAKCLISVKPVVDEMVVVDTGSTDRTKDIAGVFGAKVYDLAWKEDFSEARNCSLSKASGDWILVLDADEVLSPLDYARLTELVEKSDPVAYEMVSRNYTMQVGAQGFTVNDGKYRPEEAGLGWHPSKKVRLFPNKNNIWFENPVHEFVEGTVRRAGLPMKPCDIPVHHYGRLDQRKITAKGEAYYLLGKKKLKEKGMNNLKALFELGVQAAELKKFEEAEDIFQKLIDLDPKYPLAIFNLGFVYIELGKYPDALIISKKAFELDPEYKECAVNYAHCELVAGDINQAISILKTTLAKVAEYVPAMALLAAGYCIDGKKEKALEILERLSKKGFDCSPCLHDLASGLYSTGRFKQAISVIEGAVKSKNIHKDTSELLKKSHQALVGDEQLVGQI